MIIEYTSDISNLITNKADLVDGKVPAEQLPSYVDDVVEFNNIQVADAEISSIIGNNLYKNQIRFVNNSTTLIDRIGSEDKYPNMFVNFGENTSEDDWTTFEPEKGKIYINTTNNHSYRWSGSYLIDLDFNWRQDIKDLQENTVRTDSQDLSVVQQKQAFENLGWKVHVISKSAIGSSDAVSDDEKEARLAATALLVKETGEMYIYGHNSTSIPSDRRFYRFRDTKTLALLTVVTTTGLITQPPFVNIYDENAVSFNIDQSNVSNDRKNKALGNIGLGFVIVDYSELTTTLSDDRLSQLVNAKGVILTNTPDNYIRSVVFTAGTRLVNSITFSSIENFHDINYIVLNIPNKILSLVQTSELVVIDSNQNLSNTQKDTVLSNIGLGFILLDYSLLGTTLDDSTAALVENANGLILFNAPNNERPVILPRCSFTNNVVYFNSWRGVSLVDQITYNVGTKALSAIWSTEVPINSVKYNGVQNLTDTQKQQARSNIGATSCYDEYKLAGGTKYTTEADFNAQLVKVMDMTVVE